MKYQLEDINFRTVSDPAAFMAESDEAYRHKVEQAADLIAANRKRSPIVLLSGPSGSGKTTTSMKIAEELNRRGINTHYVALDDYFKTIDENSPRTADGQLDLESPLCVDMELLNRHFEMLSRGERVFIPKYEFSRRMRVQEPSKSIKLKGDEVVIFEGIHALNSSITDVHPEAFKLYISARSSVLDGAALRFKGTWMRLTRRAVRDYNFRGTDVMGTLGMWDNVRRGEKLYISPYKHTAHLLFDSSLPYEVSVMACYARPLMEAVPEDNQRTQELRELVAAFDWFETIDPKLVPAGSLLHEFIG